jgi:hypothetical protein
MDDAARFWCGYHCGEGKPTDNPNLILSPFRTGSAKPISVQLSGSLSFGVFSFIDPSELGIATRIHVNLHKPLPYKLHAIGRAPMLFLFLGHLRCHDRPPLSLVVMFLNTLVRCNFPALGRDFRTIGEVF